VPGRYALHVVVTDPTGRASDPVEVAIEASACGSAVPAVSVTSTPAAPATGQAVALDARVTDADTATGCGAHAATFTYWWSFAELPGGSAARINDPAARPPSFVADVPGRYILRVAVTDPTARSATATLTVTASTCGSNAPTVSRVVVAPAATVAVGQVVRLSPDIADADTDAACAAHAPVFAVAWTVEELPVGSTARFGDATALTPAWVPDVPGAYRLRVTGR